MTRILSEEELQKMVDADGSVPAVSQPNSAAIASKGVVSDEDLNRFLDEQERVEKIDSQNLKSLADAFLRGATGGLSDLAKVKSGLATQEELLEQKSVNNVFSTIGEAAGIITPAILTGGTSVAARAAAATPVGLAIKAGQLGEKALAKVIAKTGNQALTKDLVKKTIEKGAGSMVEGSLLGAQTLVSEAALGEADFNAENLASYMGNGLLYGGALGATLPVTGTLLKGAKDGLSKNFGKILKGKLSPEKAATSYVGLSDAEIAKRVRINPNYSQDLANFLKNDILENSKELALKLDDIQLQNKVLNIKETAGKEIGKIIDDVDAFTQSALPRQEQIFDPVVLSSTNAEKFSAAINKAREEGLELGTNSAGLAVKDYKNLKTYISRDGRSGYAIKPDGEVVAMFGAENPSRLLDDAFVNKKATSVRNLNPELDTVYSKYLDNSSDAFGPKLIVNPSKIADVDNITRQAVMPKNSEIFKQVADELDEKFIKRYENSDGFQSLLRPVKEIRNSLLKKAEKPGFVPLKFLNNLRQDMDTLAFKMGKSMDPTLKQEAAQTLRTIYRKVIDDVAAKVSPDLANKLKEANRKYYMASSIDKPLGRKLSKDMSSLSLKESILGVGLAGIVDPIAGGVAVTGKRFLESDLLKKFVILTNIEKANRAVATKIDTGLDKFIKATSRAVRPLSTNFLVKSTMADGDSKPKNKAEAFNNIKTKIEQYKTDPVKLEKDMAKNIAGVADAAPETAAELTKVAIMSLKFLETKIPQKNVQVHLPKPFAKEYRPSDLELSKLERYMQVLENPLTVIDELSSGTLTREHVEALKAVYPNLYSRIRNEAINKAAKEDNISYNKKVQIGILFDAPTDESMVAANLMALQSNFQQQPQQQAGSPMVNATATGASNLDLASRTATELQKNQARK